MQIDLKWRLDVTMTTNTMLKARKPSIMMELHFDDGLLAARRPPTTEPAAQTDGDKQAVPHF